MAWECLSLQAICDYTIVFIIVIPTTRRANVNRIYGYLVLTAMAAAAMAAADHPCKTIEAACEAAGYHRGEAKVGKGLFKNCMKPIMTGQNVPGVNVSPTEIQQCQAKEARHHTPNAAVAPTPSPSPAPH